MKKTAITLTLSLAIMLVVFGLIKLLSPIPDPNAGMAWTLRFDAWQVRALGVLELLAAIGIVAPVIRKRWYRLRTLPRAV